MGTRVAATNVRHAPNLSGSAPQELCYSEAAWQSCRAIIGVIKMRTILLSALGILTLSTASATAAAFPMVTPAPATGYTFTVNVKGGTSYTYFDVPAIPQGNYVVSWDADFSSQGSISSPVTWVCGLYDGNVVKGAGNATDVGQTFQYSVSASVSLKIKTGDKIRMFCGKEQGSTWTWSDRPLQVTFVRLASRTDATLPVASGNN